MLTMLIMIVGMLLVDGCTIDWSDSAVCQASNEFFSNSARLRNRILPGLDNIAQVDTRQRCWNLCHRIDELMGTELDGFAQGTAFDGQRDGL